MLLCNCSSLRCFSWFSRVFICQLAEGFGKSTNMNEIKNNTNTEHSALLKVGTIIPPIEDSQAIASWPAKKQGEFIAKIGMFSAREGEKYKYFAVSNADYRGAGLIVIIKKKPAIGEQLMITGVAAKVAFADVV